MKRGNHEVKVELTNDPAGRRCVLLQLPDAFILIHNPDDADLLSWGLAEAAVELRKELG